MTTPNSNGHGTSGIHTNKLSDSNDKNKEDREILRSDNISAMSDEESSNDSDRSLGAKETSDAHLRSRQHSSNKEQDDYKEKLAQRETKHVFRLRMVVFIVLLFAAAAVSVVVYYITKKSQNDEFETQFKGAANQVLNAFESIVKQKLGAISALAVAAIAHGVDHKLSWPFVTLSSFQQRSATAESLSDSLFVCYCPYVNDTNRDAWEVYVAVNNSWIADGFAYQDKLTRSQFLEPSTPGDDERLINYTSQKVPIFYFESEDSATETVDPGPGPFMPIWETSPVVRANMINQNIFRNSDWAEGARVAWNKTSVYIGRMNFAPPGDSNHSNRMTSFYATILSMKRLKHVFYKGDPMSAVYLPIFNTFEPNRVHVALLMAVISWSAYFEDILPPTVQGVVVVLENECDGFYTYEINGADVNPIGRGDLHDKNFGYLQQTTNFHGLASIADGTESGIPLNQDKCNYQLHVYPSTQFYHQYKTNNPFVITFAVALIFVFTAVMFLIYDRLVERRQRLIMRKAVRSSAIVSSLFPKNVRDRLMQENDEPGVGKFMAPNLRLKSYLKGDANEKDFGQQPIADLFPYTTVMFADISGFTAWSSTRDPAQVFILLQTLYHAFDILANKRGVFKVETIGDSYVAVTGLPEPQEKHAVIMARFAGECLACMKEVTKDLEVSLGPDTGDLSMRIGLHSGPVTAGVLRGERSRFQLFGDTVNTAARMESTGIPDKIQISQSTADLLIASGKDHWVKPRRDAVEAKGKGVLSTYWLNPNVRKGFSTVSDNTLETIVSSHSLESGGIDPTIDSGAAVKQERLVNWIVELLSDHIKQLLAKRRASGGKDFSSTDVVYRPPPGKMALDEVAEVISLPKFDAKVANDSCNHQSIVVDPMVLAELKDYVSTIASAYRDNPFHNFEHACHVTMAVNKFLKRIVAPDLDVSTKNSGDMASHLHDYTHGIHSDPLARFAIVFSALIHDVDHRGVSNAQLIKEDEKMAMMYNNKSVAEQNSLDLSWDLLMSPQFQDFRRCIFQGHAELRRFRQVIVNVVLATDIFDKELNDLRKSRWDKAFSAKSPQNQDLRATIVIEHIIQASDVAHTMQHWHIYRKWNQRLFTEMFKAYREERMGVDPSTFWYKGELGFFDNYIIPLAKKLKDCNVFGVSSDECLNYALRNRLEWEERGQEEVEQMLQEITNNLALLETSTT